MNTIADYRTRAFNGYKIIQRYSDDYINTNDMCKVRKGMKLNDWIRNKETLAFLDTLSKRTGIHVDDLIKSSQTRCDLGGGTWIHPKAAIQLAMWISPVFGVEVAEWVYHFISGDLTPTNELMNTNPRVLTTVTIAGADLPRDMHELLRQGSAIEQENAQLEVRLAHVVKDAAILHRSACSNAWFSGNYL
jgi:hypothetical protein